MMLVISFGVFAELVVARFVLGFELRGPLLQGLFPTSIATAFVSLILALALRPRVRDSIEFFGEHVEVPMYRGSRRRRRIRYRDVYSIERFLWGPMRILVIGTRGRLAARIRFHWLESPGDAARLDAEMRARIGLLPDGAERLRGIDRCASVWAAAGRGVPWVTWALAASLVAAFAFELAVGATTEKLRLLTLGALSPVLVGQGELDRLLTPAFLHSGPLHLFANLSTLVLLGLMLERLLGWPRFVLVLTLGQVLGALLWLRWPNADGAVGASAALYGLFGAWLVLELKAREELPVFFRLPVWWWLVTAAFGVWAEVAFSNLATTAHVGGLAGGFVAAAVVVHRPLDRLGLTAPRWLSALATLSILAWLAALGVGVQRASGLLDEQRVEASRSIQPEADERSRPTIGPGP
jgi:rhomboid protease GluP